MGTFDNMILFLLFSISANVRNTSALKPHLLKVFTNNRIDCRDDLILRISSHFLAVKSIKNDFINLIFNIPPKRSISEDIAYCALVD